MNEDFDDYVWSPVAIDYSVGVDIYDKVTDTVYTEEEAHKLPPEVRSRLTCRPRKIGCYVLSDTGLKKLAREKGWIK